MSPEQRLAENDGLCHWAVKKWCRLSESHPDYEDGVQEARIAMFRAAKAYNEQHGSRFSTFAGICMMHQVAAWNRKRKKHGFNGAVDPDLEQPLQLLSPKDDDCPVHDLWHEDKSQDAVGDSDLTEALWYYIRKLAKIDKRMAKVIYGRYYLRLETHQLSDWVGVGKPAIGNLERRARELLAGWLGDGQ